MVVKVITKVVANRLKPLMNELTGSHQASFILGRQTTDNIVLAQELVHSMRRKKGKKGVLVAAIDLEKTYDRVDWHFLEQVLEAVGVSDQIRRVVMSCITSTQLSVLWNGEQLKSFTPERGL